jgi:hypothetical protein
MLQRIIGLRQERAYWPKQKIGQTGAIDDALRASIPRRGAGRSKYLQTFPNLFLGVLWNISALWAKKWILKFRRSPRVKRRAKPRLQIKGSSPSGLSSIFCFVFTAPSHVTTQNYHAYLPEETGRH